MAKKKDFKEINPALNFISTDSQAETKAADREAPGEIAPAPEGYKINPLYVEVKSKRLNLLLQPSIVERMKKAAAEHSLSVNEQITVAIREYLEREGF